MSDARNRWGCAGQIAILVAGFIFGGVAGLLVGSLAVESGMYEQRANEQCEALTPAIANNPAFKDIHLDNDSAGFVWVHGKVPTTADKKRLEEIVTRAIGERRASGQMQVTVEGAK